MKTKPRYQPSLYLASGLRGGFIAVLLTLVWFFASDLVLGSTPIIRPLLFVFNPTSTGYQPVWAVFVPAALLSAIPAVLMARKIVAETSISWAILLAGCAAGLVGSFMAAIWSFCLVIFYILSI